MVGMVDMGMATTQCWQHFLFATVGRDYPVWVLGFDPDTEGTGVALVLQSGFGPVSAHDTAPCWP